MLIKVTKMKKMMLSRLKEPSTWSSFGGFLLTLIPMNPQYVAHISIAAAACFFLGGALPESEGHKRERLKQEQKQPPKE